MNYSDNDCVHIVIETAHMKIKIHYCKNMKLLRSIITIIYGETTIKLEIGRLHVSVKKKSTTLTVSLNLFTVNKLLSF